MIFKKILYLRSSWVWYELTKRKILTNLILPGNFDENFLKKTLTVKKNKTCLNKVNFTDELCSCRHLSHPTKSDNSKEKSLKYTQSHFHLIKIPFLMKIFMAQNFFIEQSTSTKEFFFSIQTNSNNKNMVLISLFLSWMRKLKKF